MESQTIAQGLTLITGKMATGKTMLSEAIKAYHPAVTKRGLVVFDEPESKDKARINGCLKVGDVIVTSCHEDVLRRIGFKKRAARHIRIDIARGLLE